MSWSGPSTPKTAQLKRAHQLELIDRQIGEVDEAIDRGAMGSEELKEQQVRLSQALASEIDQFGDVGSDYKDLGARRRRLHRLRESLADRADEIELVVARFQQLNDHYESDKSRLAAIEEAGSFFVLREQDLPTLRFRSRASTLRPGMRWRRQLAKGICKKSIAAVTAPQDERVMASGKSPRVISLSEGFEAVGVEGPNIRVEIFEDGRIIAIRDGAIL